MYTIPSGFILNKGNYIKTIKNTLAKCRFDPNTNNYSILKYSPKHIINTNETIGQSAEAAVCSVFNISCQIDISRINLNIKNKIILKLEPIKNNFKHQIISSEGYKNGKVDFILEENKTLSLKTLKYNDGKICPQKIGQPTLKSWDKYWKKDWDGKLEFNSLRFNFIKSTIHTYLNHMLEYLFCCDYLLLISNCSKDPQVEFLKKIKNYFTNQEIIFSRNTYEEKWNEKKQKNSEFSSTIKVKLNDDYIIIGEFQFHKSSRQEVKFRFFKKFIQKISLD